MGDGVKILVWGELTNAWGGRGGSGLEGGGGWVKNRNRVQKNKGSFHTGTWGVPVRGKPSHDFELRTWTILPKQQQKDEN